MSAIITGELLAEYCRLFWGCWFISIRLKEAFRDEQWHNYWLKLRMREFFLYSFRLFAMLESALLATPQKSGGQAHHLGCFQFVDGTTKQRLIEAYYSLDGVLCREILGKKLSSRLRKELDEISEKTNLHLKSCRRQFDNIKRVYKVIEEMPGHYVKNIESQVPAKATPRLWPITSKCKNSLIC